jgi:precorrin-6Y C5,15-methyltransferase (decarboxylating)
MQLAFARVKETWDDAYLSNLATQPLDRVVDNIRTAERVGLFTTESVSPSVVAAALLDRRIDYFTAYVCENLGTPDEIVTQGHLKSIRDQSFSPLNVMVLVRHQGAADRPSGSDQRRLFGNPDDIFLQSRPKRGLLTPSEIRCMALAEMDLTPTSVVWDVGAGSGSLAIEAAGIALRGKVYAIEMDAEDYVMMIENAKLFSVPSLVPVHGQAPEAFKNLPTPDAVFVGGSGRMVPELVIESIKRLGHGGRIVVNVSSPDNLVAVQEVIDRAGLETDVRMINIARGQYQLGRTRFEALNPTFLVLGRRVNK